MKKSKLVARIVCLLLAIAMIIGSGFYLVYIISPSGAVAYGADATTEVNEVEEAYSKLDKLKSIIETVSINYKEDISVQELVDAAYDGVFSILDDWTTYYATSEEEETFVNSLSSEEYVGVGLTLTKNEDGTVKITAVNSKGPAFTAGVKKNDNITHVNGESIKEWSLDKVANTLRGAEGTQVTITVERSSQSLNFTLTRSKLSTTVVNYEVLEDNIGYIEIDSFNLGSGEDFIEAYYKLLDEGITSFVIDVRDNPGGYMDEALNAAAALLSPGDDIVYYFQGDEIINQIYVLGYEEEPKTDKLVVLINENTASAAEAFAAALQDNDRAEVVGVRSYGKGVAQQIFEGEGNDYFKLSTFYFTGPSKTKIDGIGVTPDYIVYNNGGLTEEEIASLTADVIPMDEGKRYFKKGLYGLNVLAAQERLVVLGYEVKTNGIMDDATMTALKDVQKQAGVYVYGALDYTTMNCLEARYQAYLYGTGDAQLAKALELLKSSM